MEQKTMLKTILIVESPNDAAFYKKLYALTISDKEERIKVIAFEDLHNFDFDGKNQRGYSLKTLEAKLEIIKRQLEKTGYEAVNHIAIIVDVDFPNDKNPNKKQDGGKENRLFQVSEAINSKFNIKLDFVQLGEGNIAHTPISLDEDTHIDNFFFSCFLTKNADSEGNLDYLLKDLASKKEEAHHANCLFAWQDCLKYHNKAIKEGYLVKLWVDYYIRFDTATKDEKSDAEIKLKFDYVMSTNKGEKIFNFEHPVLDAYKTYLSKIIIE